MQSRQFWHRKIISGFFMNNLNTKRMIMPYSRLTEPIRRYMRAKRWEQLKPIQAATISRIMDSDDHFILASHSTFGKTETMFLSILSKVDFHNPGIQVLYISPFVSLLNKRFHHIEELCKYLGVPVGRWCDDVQPSESNPLLSEPKGILLITLESLESMFVNQPYNSRLLFENLKYVVVDEIHSFIGTDKGVQLQSILSRMQDMVDGPFRVIGLSATLGDYAEAKRFMGNPEQTQVLVDETIKTLRPKIRYAKASAEGLSFDALLTDEQLVRADAINSVTSFIQYLGHHSREGEPGQRLMLYATSPWELLQLVACWELYTAGVINPPERIDKPYGVFVQQLLSVVKGDIIIRESVLYDKLMMNHAFQNITPNEIAEIIAHLVEIDYLKKIGDEGYVIGEKGRKMMSDADFYRVVDSSKEMEVIVHPLVRQKMFHLLRQTCPIDYLDEVAMIELQKLRESFRKFRMTIHMHRPILTQGARCTLYTFTGTKINRAIGCLLAMMGIDNTIYESQSKIDIAQSGDAVVRALSQDTSSLASQIDSYLEGLLIANPKLLSFSKWAPLLPRKYQVYVLKNRYYDFVGAFDFIERARWRIAADNEGE